MQKNILITGSTDGIGLETARMLVSAGHHVLLHGRNPAKLADAEKSLSALAGDGRVEGHVCDLSSIANVESFAEALAKKHPTLDVLINNAGIYAPGSITPEGIDVRFAVNTVAPYLLTKRLLPLMQATGRVINLSSAAQSPVNLEALAGRVGLPDGAAYAQSKLALTMWSRNLALSLEDKGPVIIAVNPGSMLGSKMVKEAFGVSGGDIRVGAKILCRVSLADESANATGRYFDNDSGAFASPHPDALDDRKSAEVVEGITKILADNVGPTLGK